MLNRAHVMGFIAGVGTVWLYHHFVKAVPGGKSSS